MNRTWWWGFAFGVFGYWAFQHFSGFGTSGLGARKSAGGGAGPG
jgi:hypothetical protein